jgi:hypothetical protein
VKRSLSLLAGAVLVVVAAGFCIRTGMRERERIGEALRDAEIVWLVAALRLAVAAMLVIARGWGSCLALLGERRPTSKVTGWWFVGELGKYVPGAVWPVVGRGELARRDGVRRTAAYHSVGLSLAAFYGAAILPVAVVVAHPRVQRLAAGGARRLSRGRVELDVIGWRPLTRLLLEYLPSWILIAAVTVAVTEGYGADGGWQVAGATVLAWVCGFLALPVPAGAGVREAVFIATSGLDPGVAVTVAVTARLAFVVVDLLGAAVAAPAVGARRREALTAR